MTRRTTGLVLGVQVDSFSEEQALARVLAWTARAESRYVAICDAHVIVRASRDESFRRIINGADMATPDGTPVAWMLRRTGFSGQRRISGPDLMWVLCERCAASGVSIYLYGGTETTLAALSRRLRHAFPNLLIAGAESPPSRLLSEEEDAAATARINASGARLVFVGLGCPKQEHWMAAHQGRVNAVALGVGAAFDFHAGTVKRAPRWIREHGFEWLWRLCAEPRRLWRRYLVTNTLFTVGAAKQLVLSGVSRGRERG